LKFQVVDFFFTGLTLLFSKLIDINISYNEHAARIANPLIRGYSAQDIHVLLWNQFVPLLIKKTVL
jgi:hypothetical protein